MSQILLTLLAVVAIAVLPVILAARFVGAERTGFGPALLAVALQFVLAAVVRAVLPEGFLAAIAAALVGSAIYAYILDTSMLKGFIISIIATVIAVVAAVMLGASFALMASAT